MDFGLLVYCETSNLRKFIRQSRELNGRVFQTTEFILSYLLYVLRHSSHYLGKKCRSGISEKCGKSVQELTKWPRNVREKWGNSTCVQEKAINLIDCVFGIMRRVIRSHVAPRPSCRDREREYRFCSFLFGPVYGAVWFILVNFRVLWTVRGMHILRFFISTVPCWYRAPLSCPSIRDCLRYYPQLTAFPVSTKKFMLKEQKRMNALVESKTRLRHRITLA